MSVYYEQMVTVNSAYSHMIIESDGWSGKVVRTNTENETDRKFLLTVTGSNRANDVSGSISTSGAHVNYNGNYSGGIIGISLEHMGAFEYHEGTDIVNQIVGATYVSGNNYYSLAGSWGGYVNYYDPQNALRFNANDIYIDDVYLTVNGVEDNRTDVKFANLDYRNMGGGGSITACRVYPDYGVWYDVRSSTRVKTDLPIFATDADLLEYVLSEGAITNKILNLINPYSEYDDSLNFYYIKNLVARGDGSLWTSVINVNMRFQPQRRGTICLYYHEPTASEPYNYILKNYASLTCYISPGVGSDDDFTAGSVVTTHFLRESIRFNDISYRVNRWDTNIPIWASEADADDYIAGRKDIEDALNYDYIARVDQQQLGPEYGDIDNGNDNGVNGQNYAYGARMYIMTSLQLSTFFNDIFNAVNIQDILDATQLFGANQINAIGGVTYFPCDISDFCTTSSISNIRVVNWQCPNAQATGIVTNNNKLIDCGGVNITPIYGDFRDLEPYTQLYISLPYCGTHQLQLSKYLGHYFSVKYAIDVTTGGCTAHIYSDSIELDSFDGVMASQRPLSAIDQTAYMSSVINAINSATGSGGNFAGQAVQSIASGASGNIGGVTMGVVGAAAGAAEGVLAGFNVMQAVNNPPMSTRGGFNGCLGFFGNQKIHLIIAQKKTVRPANELSLIGYPSGQGGTVGSFSGFLKCSAFKMADGFTGTREELSEIMAAMSAGIYV